MRTLRAICGTDQCVQLIRELAVLATEHPEIEVRCMALELMAHAERQAGDLGVAAATLALQDKMEQVQFAALASLLRMWTRGDSGAVATVAAIAGDGWARVVPAGVSPELQREALEALPRVAIRSDPAALAAAVGALSAADVGVRLAAGKAVKQLCAPGDP